MIGTTTVISSANNYIASPEYVDFLEKMNGVHSTGLALANVFIAILACTLTVASISVAVIIWRSSKEQKEERERIHREHAEQMSEQYQLLMATYEERMQGLVGKLESIAEDAEGTGNGVADTKQELEELVAEYKNKLSILKDSSSGNVTSHTKDDIPMVKRTLSNTFANQISAWNSAMGNLYEVKNCPHCGKGYKVNKHDRMLRNSMYVESCPHCGGEV